MHNEIRSGFSIDKILDYIQYAYDHFNELHDGNTHQLDNNTVYVYQIGDYLKLGTTGCRTGFAFVKNGGLSSVVYINDVKEYSFLNGTLIETTFDGYCQNIKEVEITVDYVFHRAIMSNSQYCLTYDELLRIQEMSSRMHFDIHIEFSKK